MGFRVPSLNLFGNFNKKGVILRSNESPYVPYDRHIKRNSQLLSNFISQDGYLEWTQINAIVKDSKTLICFPICAKQI